MKTRFTWISLLLLMSAGMLFTLMPSCDKVQQAAKFKVKYKLPDQKFTIDSILHLKTEQLLFTQTFNANIDSILGANNGLLGGATFYQLQLTVVTPNWVTLNWISSARATLTPSGGAPIEVATSTTIDPLSRTINFEVKNLDLATAITGPLQLDLYGNLTGPIPVGSIQMLLASELEITIDPL